ncbi:hypothetical protein O181_069634 [Austropuccinia psidii MF-1]|uniref:Vacuolar sorting protein Vps3844 C-terminal domain-containing protein n=1 Tax=Austropuccinia psidii MF-1 TaxID=1389203 RepID=A0A9Q3EZ84_9BASI|nr:hypothetical protein [Austropuccinia psidii MF-1]
MFGHKLLFFVFYANLFILKSFSFQSAAKVYINNPNLTKTSISLTNPELNALLSYKLNISNFETLPKSLDQSTTKGQIIFGNPHLDLPDVEVEIKSKLILLIYGSDGQNLLPDDFSNLYQSFNLPNPPESICFDALMSTYIGRLVDNFKIPISQVFGVENFLKAYHDGLGGGILDNLEDWAQDWTESTSKWIEWGKVFAKNIENENSNDQIIEKEKYSQWLKNLDSSDPSVQQLIQDLKTLDDFTEKVSSSPPRISLLRLSSLQSIQRRYGENSIQYRSAVSALKSFISHSLSASSNFEKVVIALPGQPTHTRLAKKTHLSVLTPFQTSETSFVRRDLINRRREIFGSGSGTPIISSSQQCYESISECEKQTNSCNSHGECRQGQKTTGGKCFVCSCHKAKDSNGKLVKWSGETCQKRDISNEFVLLTGSTIGLIFMFFMAIALLFSIGSEGLPQQLSSVSGSNKKMD